MKTVRRSRTEHAAKTMVHAFVTSRVDYCNSIVRRESAVHIQPLQNVLNAMAPIILGKWKFNRNTADLQEENRVQGVCSLLVYKCLHDVASTYLAEMCTPVSASVN